MYRPTDNTQIDTNANWTLYDPIVNYGIIAVSVDTYQIKIGDGVNNWSDLPFVGSTTISGKNVQTNRLPQNNEILVYQGTPDKWMYHIQGVFDTAENWEANNDVFPTFALLIETNNITFEPTSRFKISDGETESHLLPWSGFDIDKTSFPTGYSLEFNGTNFEAASYLPMYQCPESATPTGTKYARDDGTWYDFASIYVTGESTVTNENIVVYDGTTGFQIKDSGISINDILLDDGTQDDTFIINVNNGPTLKNVSGELHIRNTLDTDYQNLRCKSIYSEFSTCVQISLGGFPTESTSVTLSSDGTYLYVDGNKIIDIYHDGHGCGFDADTLDGYHAEEFATPGDVSEFATAGDIASQAIAYAIIFGG